MAVASSSVSPDGRAYDKRIKAKRLGNALGAGHDQPTRRDQEYESGQAVEQRQPWVLLAKYRVGGTALPACFKDRDHKPGKENHQQYGAVEPRQPAVERQQCQQRWRQQGNGEVAPDAVARRH